MDGKFKHPTTYGINFGPAMVQLQYARQLRNGNQLRGLDDLASDCSRTHHRRGVNHLPESPKSSLWWLPISTITATSHHRSQSPMSIGYPLLHREGTLRTGPRLDKKCLTVKASKRAISYLADTSLSPQRRHRQVVPGDVDNHAPTEALPLPRGITIHEVGNKLLSPAHLSCRLLRHSNRVQPQP